MPDSSVADDTGADVLVLGGPRLADGRMVDVRLSGGRVQAVGTPGSLPPASPRQRLDLSGYVLLPAPAEPHAHHDSALTALTPPDARSAPGVPDASGPPGDSAGSSGPRTLHRLITEAALIQLGHGATAQRSHVRIGGALGLHALEAALETARTLRGLAGLGTVAVPGLLTGRAGADNRALLRDAAKMGATAVGGSPDLDPDPGAYLDLVLRVADEHGLPVDLHSDAEDPVRLTRLAAAAAAHPGGVTIGPCTGLALLPAGTAARAAERLAATGITVCCLPQGRCALLEGGAGGTGPAAGTRGTPVRLLRAAGVRVTAGSGALCDAANPVGRGDPLQAAYLLASHGACSPAEAYRSVSSLAREALGLPEVRIEPGFPAELLAVRGETVAGALSAAGSRLVVHRGRVVARTSAVREFGQSAASGGGGDGGPSGLPRQVRG